MIHFIRPGDTLQKIAEEINLENPVYLKEFHNNHCLNEDFIETELVSGRKLLLPDFAKIQFYNAKNDAPFKSAEQNPKIKFEPEDFSEIFKVEVTESNDNGDKIIKNKFSYNISLKWIKKEFNEHIFQFSKDHFSSSNDTKMGDLAANCIQSLNPIEIYVNTKGEVVRTAITKEILNDFEEIKEKVLNQFPDKYAKIYIEEFEFAVLNSPLFNERMKQDFFLKTYFSSFRNDFKNGKSFFQLSLNNSSLQIQQTVDQSENLEEIILNQILIEPNENSINFNGKLSVSKATGMIIKMNIHYDYNEYGVLYSTDFELKEIM